MSDSTGLTNGQSFGLQSAVCAERGSLSSNSSHDKHTRYQKGIFVHFFYSTK